jgi:subtilisin family serine protease
MRGEQSMAPHLDKLALSLRHALEVWRIRSAGSKELEERRIPVSVTYTGDLAALQAAGLTSGHDEHGEVSGQIAFKDVEQLALVPGVVLVEMQPNAKTLLDETLPEMRVPWKGPLPGFTGKGAGVIVAVIDTGIDIFHESFKTAGGQTRILELWDQSATTGGSAPPAGFTAGGRVYNSVQINAALTAGPPFASVDTNGHGTHVAGTAAGNGRQDDRCSNPGHYVGVAPEAGLVVVKAIALPAPASGDTREALRWCAQAGARHALAGVSKPVVINCSFGSDLGAHDGNDYSDVSIDRILRPTGLPVPAGLAVVCSAGNEGFGSTHDSGTLGPTGQPAATATVSFYMPANSSTPDPIAIWYDGVGSITVTVTAPASTAFPGTNTTGAFAPGGTGSPFTIGGMQVSITSPTAGSAAHGNKKEINLSISATNGRRMRDGVWTLTLVNTAAVVANYDIYSSSSHTDGYPVFRLPTDSGDPPARRRNNTVSSPGMGRNAITVANYSGNEIVDSSSRGPVAFPPGTPSGEVKPTIAGLGSAVTASRSRDDTDVPSSCCDQKVVDKTGTSMSSPHVAGLVALMFEKNRLLTFEQVRGHLQHSARQDGIPAAEAPVIIDPLPGIRWGNIWGAGKVNAQAALAEMPASGGGGGGGGSPTITIDDASWGFTPHTIVSRLGDWRRRLGPRPGLMLVASLVSEHVDEILRLVNRNRRVGAVWQRNGGPLVVRHLLHGTGEPTTILPERVERHDVRELIPRFLLILSRFGSARLKADIDRFGGFVALWPRAELAVLDEHALRLAESP